IWLKERPQAASLALVRPAGKCFAAGPYLLRRVRRGVCAGVTRVLPANGYMTVASGVRRARFFGDSCRIRRPVGVDLPPNRPARRPSAPPAPRLARPHRLPPRTLPERVLS